MKLFKHTIPSGKELEVYMAKPHPYLWLVLAVIFISRSIGYTGTNEHIRLILSAVVAALACYLFFRDFKKSKKVK